MGLLVNGKWLDQWYDTMANDGKFIRSQAQFRNWVTPDGAPGPSGRGGFGAEPGRYHLYVSHACPWAHRTLIFRTLKGLEDSISLSVVNWFMGENGWTFAPGDGVIADPVNDAVYFSHFKCNLKRTADYPALSGYVRDLYQQPGIAGTVHMDHIKNHYYQSHETINPTRIVPLGPKQDFTAPHDRHMPG